MLATVGTALTAAPTQQVYETQPGRNLTAQVNVSAALSGNETVTVRDGLVQLPFTTTVTPTQFALKCPGTAGNCTAAHAVNVSVAVPTGVKAGWYNGTVLFDAVNRTNPQTVLPIRVPAVANTSLTGVDTVQNVSTGTDGVLGTITLHNTGNTRADFEVNITGNLSEHLIYGEFVQAYPGTPKPYKIEYDVDSDVPFGYYAGNVTFTRRGTNHSLTTRLATRFLDDQHPTIADVSALDFAATQPVEFTVTVTDNLAIDAVEAEVERPVTVRRNNSTVTVNRSVANLAYNNTGDGVWTVTPPGDEPGEFYLTGTVTDTAGNTAAFDAAYTVSRLDAVTPVENIKLPNFQIRQDSFHKVAEIDVETPVTVTLESFDQPLDSQNETWTVGLSYDDGRTVFGTVGEAIQLETAGEVEVYLYSDTAEQYNGRLSWQGVEHSVNYSDTVFYGAFKNFTQPEDQNFTAVNVDYTCEAVRGETLNATGWDCSFFLSAGVVPPGSTLEEEAQLIVPERYRNEVISQWQTRIRQKDGVVDDRTMQRNGIAIGFIILLLYTVWRVRVYPTWMHIPAIDVEEYLTPGDDNSRLRGGNG
jgi:hypothetical protein